MRGVFQARRADARGEAKLGVVGGRKRRLVILDADDAGDGSENLLSRDAHVIRRFGEQSRRHVVARRGAVEELAAIGEPGTLLAATLDIGQVLFKLARIDHWANLRPLLERVVDYRHL